VLQLGTDAVAIDERIAPSRRARDRQEARERVLRDALANMLRAAAWTR
jgi:hypothetical protein